MEILGGLDQATREDLLEEPKYVALTFDDGPRADTTGRLLEGAGTDRQQHHRQQHTDDFFHDLSLFSRILWHSMPGKV